MTIGLPKGFVLGVIEERIMEAQSTERRRAVQRRRSSVFRRREASFLGVVRDGAGRDKVCDEPLKLRASES